MNRRSKPAPWRATACLFAVILGLAPGAIVRADDDEANGIELNGTVVDEAGKPVAGAEVTASRSKHAPVTSDEGGVFRLSLPVSSYGRVFAMLVAHAPDGRSGEQMVATEANELKPVRIVVKPSRQIEVRVCDGEGRPVEGAEIRVLSNLQPILAGRTDADGRWAGRVPAEFPGWSLYAWKPRVGFDYALGERARGSTEPPRPLPAALTLTLDGVREPLRLKAVDRDGKPLAGIKLGPWLLHKPGHEAEMNDMTDAFPETGADGIATLDWLPARLEGRFSIVTSTTTYYPPEHAMVVPDDRPVEEVTVLLLPYETLSGRVTTADGVPAADVLVRADGQGAGSNSFHGSAVTGPDGRYAIRVHSEQAYILAATKGGLAAPYRADLIVRAGKPVADADLVLGRGTRVRGQVAVGPDRKPVAQVGVQAVIDRGGIPDELKREGDRYYRGMQMSFWNQTDPDGRYEFLLGPGEYTLQGPPRVPPVKLTIPTEDPPAEVVRDFTMPRPETGPFRATVVDEAGKPVADAVVKGMYASNEARRWFHDTRTDRQGVLHIERSLDPLVIQAESPDRSRAGIARVDADAAEAQIVVKPAATATGRLVDPDGKPIAGRKISYGIRIHMGPERNSPFSWYFGGALTTDEQGGFRMPGLVVGESYEIYAYDTENTRIFSAKTRVKPDDADAHALGDVAIDLNPPEPKPYVPPTPAERAAESFAARKTMSPREKLAYTLTEAKREYTRPLLLYGGPNDPACVDLFRLFEERPESEGAKDASRPKTPAELRWEFELACLDVSQPEVAKLAQELGASPEASRTPTFAVLSQDGTFAAAFPLKLGDDGKLDAGALGALLRQHKLATRDAQAMLSEALANARADDRRVFLILSASWCGPCRMLARFLAAHKGELERHYVFVKLDISRDAHADAIRERYEGKDAANGVPWYIILDGDGKPLITSNAEEAEEYGSTNIGFPSSPTGIEHFLKMLKQTAPRLSAETLTILREGLARKP
jgi:protocatechuate 3,4-dioxygenase beta subunit